MDQDTANTLKALAEDILAVAQHPERFEIDVDTHRELLSAAENLQGALMKVSEIAS